MIKDINEYLGYVAWAKIFLFVPDKKIAL